MRLYCCPTTKTMTVEDAIYGEATVAAVLSVVAFVAALSDNVYVYMVCFTLVWILHAVMVSQLNKDEATINQNCNTTTIKDTCISALVFALFIWIFYACLIGLKRQECLVLDKLDCGVFDKLRAFYETHDPAKVNDLPRLYREYQGRKEDLLARVRQEYQGRPRPPLGMVCGLPKFKCREYPNCSYNEHTKECQRTRHTKSFSVANDIYTRNFANSAATLALIPLFLSIYVAVQINKCK